MKKVIIKLKIIPTIIILVLIVASFTACGDKQNKKVNHAQKEFTVMLDYMPNTNHTGLYVAKELGYFKDENLDVKIVEPGDNVVASVVAAKKADVGISFQEDVTYAKANEEKIPIKAIATIMQHNTSGFASYKEKNLTRPRDFEGKTYAGWGGPSEKAILKSIVEKDGGDSDSIKFISAGDLGYEALKHKVDIEWIYEGWDGVFAKEKGIPLNYIPLIKFDKRLDYYTPLIISSEDMIKNDPEKLKKFLRATKKGYEYARQNPNESAEILHKYADSYDINSLKESQNFVSKYYLNEKKEFGPMKNKVWNNYTDFMKEYKLINSFPKASECYTNELLK